jgi:hypothetical protein
MHQGRPGTRVPADGPVRPERRGQRRLGDYFRSPDADGAHGVAVRVDAIGNGQMHVLHQAGNLACRWDDLMLQPAYMHAMGLIP